MVTGRGLPDDPCRIGPPRIGQRREGREGLGLGAGAKVPVILEPWRLGGFRSVPILGGSQKIAYRNFGDNP